jgi:hypothetical protein
MLKLKKTDHGITTSTENVIELGTLQRDSKNLEDKIHIDGEDDDDDLYNELDIMDTFQPVTFYVLRRETLFRLLFIKLVSWPYPSKLYYLNPIHTHTYIYICFII